MSKPQENQDRPQRRPDQMVTALLPSMDDVSRTVDDMADLGVEVGSVRVLHGTEGVEVFDLTGVRHGRRARMIRAWKNMGGADADVLSEYNSALESGKALIAVPVGDLSQDQLVAVLREHGGHEVNYYTRGSMTYLYR